MVKKKKTNLPPPKTKPAKSKGSTLLGFDKNF